MDTTFELWDTDSGYIVGAFASVDESLAIVRTLLAAYGRDYANDLSLSRRIDDGAALIVARGEPLASLAETGTAEPRTTGDVAIASD